MWPVAQASEQKSLFPRFTAVNSSTLHVQGRHSHFTRIVVMGLSEIDPFGLYPLILGWKMGQPSSMVRFQDFPWEFFKRAYFFSCSVRTSLQEHHSFNWLTSPESQGGITPIDLRLTTDYPRLLHTDAVQMWLTNGGAKTINCDSSQAKSTGSHLSAKVVLSSTNQTKSGSSTPKYLVSIHTCLIFWLVLVLKYCSNSGIRTRLKWGQQKASLSPVMTKRRQHLKLSV